MALVTCDFFSDVLEVGCSMTVVLPQPTEEQIGVEAADRRPAHRLPGALPAARPLRRPHGLAALHLGRAVRRRGRPRRRDAGRQPQLLRQRAHGGRYWDYVSEELPADRRQLLPGLPGPARTPTSPGLSMGGYGAMKLAPHPPRPLRRRGQPVRRARPRRAVVRAPERVETVRAHLRRLDPRRRRPLHAAREGRRAALPRLHVSAGTEDAPGLVEGNRRFVAELEAKGADVTSDFRPGEHVWQLWDDLLPEVIDWMLGCPDGATSARPHEARADRGRRAERLLRGRVAAGRRRRPGRARHRPAAAPLGREVARVAGVRRRGGLQGPPRRPGRPLGARARLRRLLAGALQGRHRRRGLPPQPRPAAVRRDLPQGRAPGGVLRVRGPDDVRRRPGRLAARARGRGGRHLRHRDRPLRARHGPRRGDRGLHHLGPHRPLRRRRPRHHHGRPRSRCAPPASRSSSARSSSVVLALVGQHQLDHRAPSPSSAPRARCAGAPSPGSRRPARARRAAGSRRPRRGGCRPWPRRPVPCPGRPPR